MYETDEQLEALQALIDASFDTPGSHLASIMTPERRLSARQVVRYLQGVKHVAFATVDSRGRPFVSPLDGLFLRGRFVVGTDGQSMRARHLRRNRAVSLTHFDGEALAIVVHGDAEVFSKGDPEAERIDAVWQQVYGVSAYTLGEDIVFIRVQPRRLFTFAQHPESYPE